MNIIIPVSVPDSFLETDSKPEIHPARDLPFPLSIAPYQAQAHRVY